MEPPSAQSYDSNVHSSFSFPRLLTHFCRLHGEGEKGKHGPPHRQIFHQGSRRRTSVLRSLDFDQSPSRLRRSQGQQRPGSAMPEAWLGSPSPAGLLFSTGIAEMSGVFLVAFSRCDPSQRITASFPAMTYSLIRNSSIVLASPRLSRIGLSMAQLFEKPNSAISAHWIISTLAYFRLADLRDPAPRESGSFWLDQQFDAVAAQPLKCIGEGFKRRPRSSVAPPSRTPWATWVIWPVSMEQGLRKWRSVRRRF